MGANQSTSPLSSKTNSTTNSSNSTPEKEKNTKISPEELIQSASQVIESGRKIVKEINEAQYTTYNIFGFQNRISKQFSIADDLRYFITLLENNNVNINQQQQMNNYGYQGKQTQYLQESLAENYTELVQILAQVDALIKLGRLARSSFIICQNLILKSSQMIEYIEIMESREKKVIKQRGLKKQLDQAQCDLNDSSLILEQHLLQKIQVNSEQELDNYLLRLSQAQEKLYTQLKRFQREESEEVNEIPYELE